MDYTERKIKDAIREGMVLYTQHLRLKKTGNPYTALADTNDDFVDYQLLNKITDDTYIRLEELAKKGSVNEK